MTTTTSQVTCSLRIIKSDELKWPNHLVSTNHLQLCENDKQKLSIKFTVMIFGIHSKKIETNNLKKKKHMTSGSHFLQQNYQKRKLIYYAVLQSKIWN